jgi:hypothetical protein
VGGMDSHGPMKRYCLNTLSVNSFGLTNYIEQQLKWFHHNCDPHYLIPCCMKEDVEIDKFMRTILESSAIIPDGFAIRSFFAHPLLFIPRLNDSNYEPKVTMQHLHYLFETLRLQYPTKSVSVTSTATSEADVMSDCQLVINSKVILLNFHSANHHDISQWFHHHD